ncbi:hypothetical protein SAMN05444722_1352 [Rhodovulum sp. ES.010]|uniref:hypothetical protein n=1 Tax=Rhodovulum sp. ES.010 TaxID=1882821 RepID=UPI00092C06A1|nr:hypothetical protein [Rhodovulum sp. ES.010]SIO30973.1 hypothetical protein SAMN05444722_1352 [Rhodovulum sp. ES.010]
MSFFATEFPVQASVSKEKFAATALAWVKGMKKTTLFDAGVKDERHKDHAALIAPDGECLVLKQADLQGGFVSGARHELPDDAGRLWRSEIVLTSLNGKASLRVKSQCLSVKEGVQVMRPRKPYFVKMALDDGWGNPDAAIQVRQEPHVVDSNSVKIIADAIDGDCQSLLPIVLFSHPFADDRAIEPSLISRTAFNLGGVAHVFVEETRDESLRLMDLTDGENPYGGTVGIILPRRGVVKKLFRGWLLPGSIDVISAMEAFVQEISSQRQARFAWDWQDLLEESARQLRETAEKGSEEYEIWEKLREEENREKEEEVRRLRAKVEELSEQLAGISSEDDLLLSAQFSKQIGPQLYPGEFSDRLRLVTEHVLESSNEFLDRRTWAMLERISSITNKTGRASKLAKRLKNAGRDSGKADARFEEILRELGFTVRRDGGHPVCSPPEELFGVGPQTLSTSPSDHRAGKNKASQIINGLFLKGVM